ALSACTLRHQVRLALWGAEEYGLLGSTHYIRRLDPDERAKIALYLNLDMIASPNPVRFVYDGDGSAWGKAGPDGSAAIEAEFAAYFADRGLPIRETPFDGRSDYWAFINHGIPAGGLFTGAEGAKTTSEVAVFGGEAGLAYDPCYHAPCDDRDNYDPDALLDNTRATAHVLEIFATRDPPLPPADPTVAPRASATLPPAPPCDHLE
ncbi:MAG TPA: M28 family peptidase, partial [Nannocystis sp.]